MRLFFVALFFLLALTARAQPAATATLDSNHIAVGDAVRLRIKLPNENGTLVGVATSAWDSSGIAFLSRNAPQPPHQQDFLLTSFEEGNYALKPLVVTWQNTNGIIDTALTNSVSLQITAPVLPDSAQLLPLKNIVAEVENWTDFVPLAATLVLFALLLGLLFWLFWRKKMPPPVVTVPAAPQKSAFDVALAQLNALQAQQLWQNGEHKAYHTQLSFIVRNFLEKELHLPALESTTAEIMVHFKNKNKALFAKLKYFFEQTDLVKFACSEPPPELHDQLWREAKHLISELKA